MTKRETVRTLVREIKAAVKEYIIEAAGCWDAFADWPITREIVTRDMALYFAQITANELIHKHGGDDSDEYREFVHDLTSSVE